MAKVWIDQSGRREDGPWKCAGCGVPWPRTLIGPPFVGEKCHECGGEIVTASPVASTPDAPNVSWTYECRACAATLFRVSWYAAPRGQDGEPRPPGWATECDGCGRVTLLPEAPDMTEARSTR